MREILQFYIGGQFVSPLGARRIEVINPATEAVAGVIAAGDPADVNRAVAAARAAFPAWSRSSREERIDLLQRIVDGCEARAGEIAAAITEEMGAPKKLAQRAQAPIAINHLRAAIEVLRAFEFEEARGATRVLLEPIGVCGLITPWNWPLNQITCKVAPALATGCTIVLKPSEIAPFSAQIFAEIVHAAGAPAGVFNLIHGDGPSVGAALSAHADVDMVSFTGSTRAGIEVARSAAATVKRVHQELGGKSPNIILDDEQLVSNVARGVIHIANNSGQSCNAPSRMLVPAARMGEAIDAARGAAESLTVGDPNGDAKLGPVASEAQWNKIQGLIKQGVEEGATIVAGGPGRPAGLSAGYFVRPTVFTDVKNDMTIAREEIFGPVLVLIPYGSIDEAIEISNDTEYGLAAYVNGVDENKARSIAGKIRAGQVTINAPTIDMTAPFGGYKRSGNGREWGDYAFRDFLEVKAILGFARTA